MLFIDARKMGRMVDRTHRELTDEDIARIAGTYHFDGGNRRGTDEVDQPVWPKQLYPEKAYLGTRSRAAPIDDCVGGAAACGPSHPSLRRRSSVVEPWSSPASVSVSIQKRREPSM